MREWETLKAVERYDFDPTLEAATQRIWIASECGKNYYNPAVDKRDIICVMNYLDGLATGMEQNLYIEAVIKDHMSAVYKHAVENFVHTGIIDPVNIRKVVAAYDRWFPPPPDRPPSYRSGGPKDDAS